MNQTIFSIVTAAILLVFTSGNAHSQALIQTHQVTSTSASTSSKPVVKTESEPVELSGLLAAHNETRAKLGLRALEWSSELTKAATATVKGAAIGSCAQSGAVKAGKTDNASIFWAPGLRRLGQAAPQDILARYVVSRWSEEKSDQFSRMTASKAKTVGCARMFCSNQTQIWACRYGE